MECTTSKSSKPTFVDGGKTGVPLFCIKYPISWVKASELFDRHRLGILLVMVSKSINIENYGSCNVTHVCSRIPSSAIRATQQETKHGWETRRNRSGLMSCPTILNFLLEVNEYGLLFACFTLVKVNNLKQTDKLNILKPKGAPVTAKPTKQERKQTTTFAPTTLGVRTKTKLHCCLTSVNHWWAPALLHKCPPDSQDS